MSSTDPDDHRDDLDEKPLDPAMENVRRKMVKLQLVSGGIMLVMLMAVLGTIVYKVTRPDPRATLREAGAGVPSGEPVSAVATLPAGFAVTSTALSGGQILFYGTTAAGETKALVFDIAAGRIVADVLVTAN
ncbi:hypothetical protein [Ensifer soli]|uniref:hypothetical protein n=1 Tax=Ciceribacter sp. sgz301302 TaxID=3342379 RepID=UPI0035B7BD8B